MSTAATTDSISVAASSTDGRMPDPLDLSQASMPRYTTTQTSRNISNTAMSPLPARLPFDTRKPARQNPPSKIPISKVIANTHVGGDFFEAFGSNTTHTPQNVWKHRYGHNNKRSIERYCNNSLDDYASASFELLKPAKPDIADSLDHLKRIAETSNAKYTGKIRKLKDDNARLELGTSVSDERPQGFCKEGRAALTGLDGGEHMSAPAKKTTAQGPVDKRKGKEGGKGVQASAKKIQDRPRAEKVFSPYSASKKRVWITDSDDSEDEVIPAPKRR